MSESRTIPFDAFMRTALHDPRRGYYARNIRGVGGGRADFTTVPGRFSGILSTAVARWAAAAMRETGCRDLIEIGPGEGTLMRGVIAALPWRLRWRTRFHLVETSEVLRTRQQALLGRGPDWHVTPAQAMRACSGRAVIFSNELVDAFPVRVFQKSGDSWRELAVELNPDGRVTGETWLDCDRLPDSTIFALAHAEGQRVEVHESYQHWLASWLSNWRAGEMLTIDYGASARVLYGRRPAGTLRGYLLHERVTGAGIYQNVGLQDLTADVNFSDLERWADPHCMLLGSATLADFLRDWGGRTIPAGLADPHGAGGAFHVLRQRPRGEPV